MNTNLGYSKLTLTDSNVLLSGGGHKALSDFVGTIYWDSTNKKIQYKKIGDTNYTDLLTFGSNAFNSTSYLPLSGGTMTGGITCSTSGANLKWGNITIYGGGSNGGINSLFVGDNVTIGDCNLGGIMGMKSTGTNAGFKFFNSSGTSIGGVQSTNGTLQWQNASGTFYNIYHSGNLPAYPTKESWNYDDRYLRYYRYSSSDTPNANSLSDGWHDAHVAITNAPTTNHGTLILNSYNGTPFLIFIPDASYYIYKRYNTGSIGGTWTKISAGYADSAGAVAWTNVTSKPEATGGATTPVYWNGSGFTNCTAYADASVNYATSAGSTGTLSATSCINGSTSELPHLIWHIPNTNWGNLSMNASGEFFFRKTNNTSESYANLYANLPDYAKLGAHNNLTASTNEFTFASSGFSGAMYINYRTAGGTNGNITSYLFCKGNMETLATLDSTGTILTSSNWSSYISNSGGGSYNGGNITGTFSSSNGVPLQFTGVGSGTYNVCQWYCNSDGITLETPRATDSAGATSLPFMVKTRGGLYGTLKAGDIWSEGTLYVKEGYGIESRPSGDGLLVYHPYSYTGVASSQWGVGAASCQGVIRSSNSDLIHYRLGADAYTIWDSYNFSPSSYLAKIGGTMNGAIKFRNDRTGIYNLGAGGSTPSGYTTTNDGGNQIMGLISWDGASDEGGILVGSDCCIIYNSSDSGYLFKCVDKDVSSALGNGFGESNVRFVVTDGGEGKFYSNCYAANFYTTSDIRKKTNIINISDSIRQFNWKDSGDLSYGFIAQELEKTNPELVNKGKDHWTVNYNAAICLVIARLENRIKELEKQLGV